MHSWQGRAIGKITQLTNDELCSWQSRTISKSHYWQQRTDRKPAQLANCRTGLVVQLAKMHSGQLGTIAQIAQLAELGSWICLQ